MNAKRLYLLLCTSLIVTAPLFSQSKLSGRVLDSEQTPLPHVILMLLDERGERLIGHTLSDSVGYFSLDQLKAGKYLLKTQYLGFAEYSKPHQLSDKQALDLGAIILKEEVQGLSEVVVSAQKSRPLTKMIGSKLRIEVANSYLSNMSNALEVLRSTPSVRVSRSGEIKLSSLGGVALYHDGKRIRLSGEALGSYLSSLPVSNILQIEISANPDASHDADGAGGIINIITHPLSQSGYHITLGQGFSYWKHLRSSTDITARYATGAWSLALMYSQTIGHYAMSYGQERILYGERSVSTTKDTDKRNPYTAQLEVGFRPNKHHQLSLSLSGDLNRGQGYTGTQTNIYDNRNQLYQTLWAENDYIKQRKLRYGSGLTYRFSPSSKHTLTTSFDWLSIGGGVTCLQPNTYTEIGSGQSHTTHYRSENLRAIDIYALATDYKLEASNRLTLEIGGKASYIQTDNKFLFRKNDLADPTRSNHFTYQERSLEGYALGKYSHNNWRYSLGIRVESLQSLGVLTPLDLSSITKQNELNRLNLFPSASATYSWEGGELTLAYSRRQDKPKYEELNPFEYLLDERTYWKGNPFLRPQISDKISLNANFGSLGLMASYQRLSDLISSITEVHTAQATIMTSQNIGRQILWSIEGNYHKRFTSWWTASLEAGAYHKTNWLTLGNALERYSQPSLMLATSSTLSLPWGLTMELSGRWYSERLSDSYERSKSSGAIDLGLSKTWLNGRLKTSLLGTDLLHTERWDSYGTRGELQLSSWGYGESRQIRLTLRYELGKSSAQEQRAIPSEAYRL